MRMPSAAARAAILVMLAAIVSAPTAVAATDSAGAVSAVWTPKELRFVYMGFTSKFSCDGLADRMREVLLLLGARKDLQVSPSGCSSPYGRPDPFPGVMIRMNVLEPAGNAQGGAQGGNAADYRRAMVACLDARGYSAQWGQSGAAQVIVYPRNGQSDAQTQSDRYECHRWAVSQSGYDPTRPAQQSSGSANAGSGSAAAQPVLAHWKMIDVNAALAKDPLWQAGQCELLEQIKQSVLPKFSTRNVQYHSTCIPYQLYLGATQLRAEVLVPDEQDAAAPPAAPPAH
jgi:hypothetical protein